MCLAVRRCVGRGCAGVLVCTSMGKALKLTVCSDPLWFSLPQWKRTSCSSYSWSLGKGPPLTTGSGAGTPRVRGKAIRRKGLKESGDQLFHRQSFFFQRHLRITGDCKKKKIKERQVPQQSPDLDLRMMRTVWPSLMTSQSLHTT